MAAVQQNTTYKRELVAGDVISIRSRILEIRERVIRFEHHMTNEETREVVAATELTAVHLDLHTRKAVAFSSEIATRVRELMSAAEV